MFCALSEAALDAKWHAENAAETEAERAALQHGMLKGL